MTEKLKKLREDYERLANMYLDELVKAYELDPDNGYWVGDEVGGVYCNGDMFSVSFDDMIFIVTYNVPKDEFLEWVDYCLFAHEFGQPEPNLKSWYAGCPRHNKETRDRITELKRNLITEINELTIKNY